MELTTEGQKLTVEAETYIGLSITGDEPLVPQILARVAAQRARHS